MLALPFITFAHGAIEDGHTTSAEHHAGEAALMKAFSGQWWGLLIFSLLAIAGLSYCIWRYLQVEMPKKEIPK